MFKNSINGLKKIYIGILLQLVVMGIGALASLISLIFGDSEGFGAVVMVIMTVLMLLAMIASYVFQLIGTFKNKEIDQNFLYAFICLIVCVVMAVLNFIVSNRILSSINSLLGTAASILAVYFVLTGCVNLIKEFNNEELTSKTLKARLIIMILLGVAGVISFVSIIMRGGERTVMGILSIIEALVTLAAYVIYFLYLKRLLALEPINEAE
ncbi:MAG: hypothetical protein J5666_05185 [Bacilli bacterium]|nr:hypothetical protein [Bacilli bacterium]